MAATNFTPISIYYSATATNVPVNTNLVAGELAINTNDGKLFYKDSAGVVQVLATKATTAGTFASITDSGLTSGRVTYATTGGLLTDSANMTYNGTTLTLANDASISGLTVGKGSGAVSTNTAFGSTALLANTTGAGNTAFGLNSLSSVTTASQNTSVGRSALYLNTGADNSALGYIALYANTTGASNTALGSQALQANTTASNNTAVGYQAGYTNQTGARNTFIGYLAGYTSAVVSANAYNTFVGAGAGQYTTTGAQNTFIGDTAGQSTTGGLNTFIGQGSGFSITTGTKNSILGMFPGNQGGLDIRTASNYIVLSDGDGNPRQIINSSGQVIVGSTVGVASAFSGVAFAGSTYNGLGLNDTTSTSGVGFIYFQIGGTTIGTITRVGATSAVVYNTTSDQRLKSNITDANPVLDKLMNVKVRQYDWTGSDVHQDAGFIAQELAPILSGIVTEGKTEEDMWQLDYARLTPYLVKAIQEQQTLITDLTARLTALEAK
jgi:hypothetical protein